MTARNTGRKAAAAVRGLSVLERVVVVAAFVAVLVAVGAGWFAMNRPAGGAESAASTSSAGAGSVGGTDAAEDQSTTDESAPAPGDAATEEGSGEPASGGAASGSGSDEASSDEAAGSGGSSGSSSRAPGTSTAGGPAPATAFLNALAASGLAPPVDDEQQVTMARDVCDELDNGSTYADMVRALTFAGASDAEATNFTRLAITHLCPEHPVG